MRSLLILLVLSFTTRVSAARVEDAQTLNLAVGENQSISAQDVKSFSEGAPGIADVKITPNGGQFVVVGQHAGSTTLLLIRRDGSEQTWNINVFARPVRAVEQELQELIGDQTGIRVKKIGARFFIEGGVSTEADLDRLRHIAALYQGQVECLVVLGGVAADRKINIRVDFFFVQYDKTQSYRFGANWPGQIAGPGFASGSFAWDFVARAVSGASASVSNQPLPGLDVAASNGWAKVLKHATVITSNGAQAAFSSGGVQNFAIVGGLSNNIQSIRFGTNVQVLPRFDPSSREIAVNIDADVADLTAPTGATSIPGQNINKLNTNVALKLGQSVVLSGIRTSAEQKTTRGLPWLSRIPVLGLLFGSKEHAEQDIEGALFIVPSVIDTASGRSAELIERAVGEFERYEGDLEKVAPWDEQIGGKR
ncbi:MAG: pilus assembly protein N-terminal domain-containing protein [Polyangiales bacterium]